MLGGASTFEIRLEECRISARQLLVQLVTVATPAGSVPGNTAADHTPVKSNAVFAATLVDEFTEGIVEELSVIFPEVSQVMDPSCTLLVAVAVLVLIGLLFKSKADGS